jgi:hypothetical protein
VREALPRVTKVDETQGGWRLDVQWLDRLKADVEKATGYQVTLECVEETALRVEALLAARSAREVLEPVAWIVLSKDEANVRIWWRRNDLAKEWAKTHNAPLIPLYTHPRCTDAVLPLAAPPPSAAREALESCVISESSLGWDCVPCNRRWPYRPTVCYRSAVPPSSKLKTCLDATGLKITSELYRAVNVLKGASPCLLAMIGSWGDTLDDADILAGLQRNNEMGECFAPEVSARLSAAPAPSPQAGESEKCPDCGQHFPKERGHHADCPSRLPIHTEDGRKAIIEALEDVARIKVQRDNALLDMEKFMNQAENLAKTLEPFAKIALVRDAAPGAYNDMIDAPDLAITPKDVRRARSALAAARHRGEGNDSPVETKCK